jgi:hypothetical protein
LIRLSGNFTPKLGFSLMKMLRLSSLGRRGDLNLRPRIRDFLAGSVEFRVRQIENRVRQLQSGGIRNPTRKTSRRQPPNLNQSDLRGTPWFVW